MKKYFLFIVYLYLSSLSYGQKEKKNHTLEFGKQIEYTVDMPTLDAYLTKVTLFSINNKYAKEYYNQPEAFYENDTIKNTITISTNKGRKDKNLVIISREDVLENPKELLILNNANGKVLIPPLKPDTFYYLEIKYVRALNKYKLFNMMYEENLEVFSDRLGWVKSFKMYSKLLNDRSYQNLNYFPKVKTLKDLKTVLRNNHVDNDELLKMIIYDNLSTLSYHKDLLDIPKLKKIKLLLMKNDTIDSKIAEKFLNITGDLLDVVRAYDFYKRRIASVLDTVPDIQKKPSKFRKLVDEAIAKEKDDYNRTNDYIPGFLLLDGGVEEKIIAANKNSTFSEMFETNQKRRLTPDFGLAIYVPTNYDQDSKRLKGVAPYFGLHIPLQAVNKDIPYKISDLTWQQQTSIHIGITVHSLKKEGYRDDLLGNVSLLVGGGYLFQSQATRINTGLVIFKDINAVTDSCNITSQPYIALSVDLDVKKWIGQLPTFFK